MLACRVRIRGERVRREEHSYRWDADPDARAAFIAAADRWCRAGADGAAHSLTVGTAGCFAVTADEDVVSRICDALSGLIPATVATVEDSSFRTFDADVTGAVTLVVGGPAIEGDGWREPLAGLTSFLRANADHLVYGHIRRGWGVNMALALHSLPADWPERADEQPRGAGWTYASFDDLYAPDAFAVQLLGPGYAGRVPELPAWRAEAVGREAVLLQHTDPAAWFDEPFVPFHQDVRHLDRSPPEILVRARAELAPILYVRGALA